MVSAKNETQISFGSVAELVDAPDLKSKVDNNTLAYSTFRDWVKTQSLSQFITYPHS